MRYLLFGAFAILATAAHAGGVCNWTDSTHIVCYNDDGRASYFTRYGSTLRYDTTPAAPAYGSIRSFPSMGEQLRAIQQQHATLAETKARTEAIRAQIEALKLLNEHLHQEQEKVDDKRGQEQRTPHQWTTPQWPPEIDDKRPWTPGYSDYYANYAKDEKYIVENGGYCNETADCVRGLACVNNACVKPNATQTSGPSESNYTLPGRYGAGADCSATKPCSYGFGIPPISRTHPIMPRWQLEVCDGNQGTAEVYGGIQA